MCIFFTYGLFTWQHDCLRTTEANQQTFLQVHTEHIVADGQLMGLFCKIVVWPLAKYMASAWQVHNDWFMTSCSSATSHEWSTTWQVDNDFRQSWALLCHFASFIMVVMESCCHVNSTLQQVDETPRRDYVEYGERHPHESHTEWDVMCMFAA